MTSTAFNADINIIHDPLCSGDAYRIIHEITPALSNIPLLLYLSQFTKSLKNILP